MLFDSYFEFRTSYIRVEAWVAQVISYSGIGEGNSNTSCSAPVSQRSWVQIPYGPGIFFQVLLTTTSFSSVLSCEDLLISSLVVVF